MLERRKEAQKNAIFPFYPLFGFSQFLPSKAIPTSNYYLLFFIFRAVGYFFYFAITAGYPKHHIFDTSSFNEAFEF